MKVLFTVSEGGLGHFHPLVPLARAVASAGHDVAFACSPGLLTVAETVGFPAYPAGGDARHPDRRRIQAQLARIESGALRVVYFGLNQLIDLNTRLMVPDLMEIASHWHPDLVVREQWELGGAVTAEVLGLPHAAIQVSIYSNGARIREATAERLDRIRSQWDLPPDPRLEMYHRYLTFSFEPPSLQRLTFAELPKTLHTLRYTPFDQSGDERLPDWVTAGLPRPVIYLTLGTTASRVPGQLEAVVGAMREEGGTLIVSCGRRRQPRECGPQPPHVHIERYLPEAQLLPYCDLVVMHGGHQTMLGCLTAGLPMVIIPQEFDQAKNGRYMAELGAGIVVDPDFRPAVLRAAVRKVLKDPRFRRRATVLRFEMESLPDLDRGVRLLEDLVREKSPQVASDAPTK